MIQEHPTWYKHHATKIEDFLTCDRYFFYKTIAGVKAEDRHNHKSFGSAWHDLMEALLQHGYTADAMVLGIERFIERYRQDWGPETDELFTPKTPSVAAQAAAHYIQNYSSKDAGQQVLYTEACGAVPLSNNRVIRFKVDSIIRDERGVFSREHKTASRMGRQWVDQWQLSMQVGTYTHMMYCLFPENEVWGVEINGTVFQKTKIDFIRVPCRASLPMLNAWLYDVNNWIDRIEAEIEKLMTVDSDDASVMQSFPRNPKSCTDYYGCEYHPFCMAWPNPLRSLEEGLPIGFKQDYWDPEADVGTVDLGVLG